MAFNWIEGYSVEVPVIWQDISEIIEVNTDKELTGIEISCISKEQGNGGFFDLLSVAENLVNQRINGGNITYISVNSIETITNNKMIPIFAAINKNKIKAVHFVPSKNINISNDTSILLSIINVNTTEVLCTKTIQANIIFSTLVDFGPVAESTNVLNERDCLCLKVTFNGITTDFPDSVIVIEWDIC